MLMNQSSVRNLVETHQEEVETFIFYLKAIGKEVTQI